MPEAVYDAVIVGAGAAGCAAAMALPRGARGLLIDRRPPDAARCCGGLLAPDAQAAIDAIGLDLPDHVRAQPEPHAVRVHDLDSGHRQTYRRNYVNLDRARFDAWLLDLAARHAEFRPRTRFLALEPTDLGRPGAADAPLVVHMASGDRAQTVPARCLIGADGAGSAVRRAAFGDLAAPATMTAIQVRLADDAPPAVHEVLFASRLTDFYAWAIPKPGSVLVGSAFGWPRGTRDRFEEILRWFRESLGLRGEVLERSARRLTRPRTRRDLWPGAGPVLLAGEAAGLVSPSSGEGLSFAIESGAAAGRAAASPSPADAYRRAFARSARRVALKFPKARVVFSPRLRRWALRIPWCP